MKCFVRAWILVCLAAAGLHAQFTQSGLKLVGSQPAGISTQGFSAAISADGNTAIVGGPGDNLVQDVGSAGAVWIFVRGANGAWTQQGPKLVASSANLASVGFSVAISADGNTAIAGGPADGILPDGSGSVGAAYVFTRSGTAWSQQAKLVGSGSVGASGQGFAVGISGDGNTAIVGGPGDNPGPDNDVLTDTAGAVWIFTRSGNIWTQQGSKLIGPNANGTASQGASVALSGDGNTALVGGPFDASQTGAGWAFARNGNTWTPQGKLTPSGSSGETTLGYSAALSSDGNTAILGGPGDGSSGLDFENNPPIADPGTAFVFTRNGGVWTQQGSKLVGHDDSDADTGVSVSLSADGNTAAVGGGTDSNETGAVFVFTRSGAVWTQLGNKLVGTQAGGGATQGWSVSLSGDGKTLLEGAPQDDAKVGAVWFFSAPPAATGPPTVSSLTPAVSSGASQTFTVNLNAPGGYQTLDVVNILINTALDGRQACYLAYSLSANTLYIVPDSGDATQLTGKVMNGTGTINNSQCTVTLGGSSATGSGTTFTLVVNLSFAAAFGGNKVVYAAVRDLSGNNSGWQTAGVHFVPGAATTFPNPTAVNAPSPDAAFQTITFTYQDQSNATDLQTVWALVNTAIDGRAACYAAYYRPGNLLYLYPDNGDGTKATNIALAGSNAISNSQCTISSQGSSAQISGNTLTLTLSIGFTPAFAGFKGVWLAAQTVGLVTSPWQALGALVVP